MAFMIAQRAFLKMYLIGLVEEHNDYGYQMFEELQGEFKALGYDPPQSEIYRSLHDLVADGILYRTKQIKNGDFQEIVIYRFVDGADEKVKLYKKQVKADLDRCLAILNKAVHDNY